MYQGIYEQLITKLVALKINELDKNSFQIKTSLIDKFEASHILSQHLSKTIKHAFELMKGDDIEVLQKQIEISNKVIHLLKEELQKEQFEEDLIEIEGEY